MAVVFHSSHSSHSDRRISIRDCFCRTADLPMIALFSFAAAFTPAASRAAVLRPHAALRPRMQVAEDDESERARLERLGREEAERVAKLDSSADDDGVSLAAEFSKRLDSEGGRIGIEGKIAQENVEEAARAAQQKADQVAAQAKSQVTRLPENVKTIGLIIAGSIVATIVFNSIGNALS